MATREWDKGSLMSLETEDNGVDRIALAANAIQDISKLRNSEMFLGNTPFCLLPCRRRRNYFDEFQCEQQE